LGDMVSLSNGRISRGKAAKTPVFAAFLVNPLRLIIVIIALFSNKSNICLGLGLLALCEHFVLRTENVSQP